MVLTTLTLLRMRTRIEAAGLRPAGIGNLRSWFEKAVYGLPGRDEQIDRFCTTVHNAGRAGVPMLDYTFPTISLTRVYRTRLQARGRGGALVTRYDHEQMLSAPMLGIRPIGVDELWEHYAYFARVVIPVAEEAGVKMALHPDDPPMPPVGGVAGLFTSVEAFQLAIDLVPSEYNGVTFCQGCFTEMGGDVYEAIRTFGERKRIFAVHFRNVRGTMPKFSESFIDGGDVDMLKAMRVYSEVGYDGPMVPDHLPHLVGPAADSYASWAFALGYMRANAGGGERELGR